MGYNNRFYNKRWVPPQKKDPYYRIKKRRRKPLDREMIDLFPKADKRFVALDFEFMDGGYSSVCSVGLVVVENGKIVDKYETLVRPTTQEQGFYQYNTHHIKLKWVQMAPRWTEIWPKLEELIGDSPIVSYNIIAEKGGLEGCAEEFGTRCDYQYIDVYQMAQVYHESRLSDGEQLCNYHLPIVCEAHDVKLNNHHTAIEDATAAAQLFLKFRALGTDEVWSTPCR